LAIHPFDSVPEIVIISVALPVNYTPTSCRLT